MRLETMFERRPHAYKIKAIGIQLELKSDLYAVFENKTEQARYPSFGMIGVLEIYHGLRKGWNSEQLESWRCKGYNDNE